MKMDNFLRLSDKSMALMGLSATGMGLMTLVSLLGIPQSLCEILIKVLTILTIGSALSSFILSQIMLIFCDKVTK